MLQYCWFTFYDNNLSNTVTNSLSFPQVKLFFRADGDEKLKTTNCLLKLKALVFPYSLPSNF